MENTELEHPWEQPEIDDEIEEGLITRKSDLNRTPPKTTINNGDFTFNNGSSVNGEHQNQEQEDEEDENDEKAREYSVYYDADKGNGLHIESTVVEANGVDSNAHTEIAIPENAYITRPNQEYGFEFDKSLSPQITNKTEITEITETEVVKDSDDEIEERLIARKSNPNQTPPKTTINNGDFSINNGGSVNGEHQNQEQEDEKEREYSVYYDTDKGNGLHLESTVVEANGADSNAHTKITIPENAYITRHNQEYGFEFDKSLSPQITNKTEITEITENEVVKDGDDDDEVTEFDVETVLKKQDTHDLFCPNCNSCITKRVILRKRKRRIPVLGDDSKRNKPETRISSDVNGVLYDSSDDQSRNRGGPGLNDDRILTSDEYDRQNEPDVFRCLSCFSIFMPTGNGFKLFRIFGNKSVEENDVNPRKEVPVKKKRWFSNFFGADKDTAANLKDSGAVRILNAENNVVGVSVVSFNLNSSRQEANSQTTNGTTGSDTLEERNSNESDNTIKDSNGKITTDSAVGDTQQLLSSYHIEANGKSDYPGMFVVMPPFDNVEVPETSISPFQHDGLKLVIPPNVGSLIIDNSHMNQELDVTVQMNNHGLDEKEGAKMSFSPLASTLGQSNLVGGQTNDNNLSINGKEHKTDKDKDIMPEVTEQHTFQNNVEIHVDEDVLTNKQIQLLEDLKNIERVTGKDTIITIETKQPDASIFQRSGDTLGARAMQNVESGSQAVVAQRGGATVATGGRSLDIVKSIVYGGLMESITSLSVVSSAVGADAATLNVLALGLANIFGGLFVIGHDLWDLKNERTRKSEDRYQQLLGQRSNFTIHMVVSVLSYLVFGFLPPIVYGFSFRESNDKDLKLLMVAVASIVCIMTLAAGKAYVQNPRKSYFKTMCYYVVFGFMVSGASYLFGDLIMKLLEKIDVFPSGSVVHLSVRGASLKPGLATY